MRLLVGLRHDADLANDAFVVDLTGSAVGAGPFGNRPAPDAFLIGIGNLVVFTVVFPGVL
jgi:hypothetical protein